MIHRWSSLSCFKLLLALPFLVSCTDTSSGSLSSSSDKSVCSGEGGLFPTPVLPQSLKTYDKFALPEKATSAVAIVDEKCVINKSKSNSKANSISNKLLPQIQAQQSLLRERAYVLELPAKYSTSNLKAQAMADECLLGLSENIQLHHAATTVNDPQYSSLTHLTAIDASNAWDTFYADLTGEVVIAIIDDGMELTHSDLSPSLWVNPGEIAGNSIDDDGNGYVDDVNGYNFASSLASPAHENGSSHGTHVAGLAAAKDNNSVGITGVMGRNTKIMVLNVFGPNAGASAAAVVNAINYAAAKGAHVINMSLGGPGTFAAAGTAMANAVAQGTFIAVAAGNDDELVSASNPYAPMLYAKDIAGAVAVGSVDATSLARSSFSNYSTTYVEIGAPGSNTATSGVLSTYPGNTYQYLQGTSMASPVLAGGAALIIGWAQARGITLSPAEVEDALRSSADSRSALAPYFTGGALLNLTNLAAVTSCF